MANTFTIDRPSVCKLLGDYQKVNQDRSLGDGKYQKVYLSELAKLDEDKLAAILEATFDASLREEEGKHHRFSVVVSPPEAAFEHLKSEHTQSHNHGSFSNVFSFAKPIKIDKLAKLAPAFADTNRKLRVWFNGEGDIEIWGVAATSTYFDYRGLEISAFAAGQLLIQRERPTSLLPRHLLTFSRLERITRTSPLLGLLSGDSTYEGERRPQSEIERNQKRYRLFIDIINGMSSHRHGGTLLVVAKEFALDVSLDCPTRPTPAYSHIENKLRQEEKEVEYIAKQREETNDSSLTREPWRYEKDSNFIGQLTAIDGATVITKELRVLALGAKIRSNAVPTKILIQDSFQTEEERASYLASRGREYTDEDPNYLDALGGTRHQSAARFVYENRAQNVFAIVASQDGRVSIIYCDKAGTLIVFRHAEFYYYGVKI